ncbi:phosphatidate cytidylyltransferase [Hymenobacter jeollabukensis]|uniref:Phosphatidate cytidylyltransferase n=1 Tax=Hymenobacter jeollabukensis TaxID=2025313 RepID=A0A5R8WTX2_9BACT|nr:phosphatidate cytidylyltransferase [Hymenobacter jeollabukensis]TLM95220.1 phosphatidate cytidylyltransferase [Hymenobacter jeollabukensis]
MTTPATPESADAQQKPQLSNMWQRIISGVIGAVLLLGSIWYSGWTFGLFFGLVQARMLWEFYRMMKELNYKPAAIIGGAVSLLIFAVAFIVNAAGQYTNGYTIYPPLVAAPITGGFESGSLATTETLRIMGLVPVLVKLAAAIILLLPIILIIREMFWWPREKQPFSPFPNVGVALLGLFYVTLPMSGLNVLAFTAGGYDYRRIFGLLFMVWAADTGAYAAGKTFGKHKLALSISPGKTWEGWVGGTLLTLAVGWALGYLIPEMPLVTRLVAALVVAVFGVLGDLAESMLKRSVGVKDSGRIMPGHGGLLDRFDAFLFVVPVLVVLQLLFGA